MEEKKPSLNIFVKIVMCFYNSSTVNEKKTIILDTKTRICWAKPIAFKSSKGLRSVMDGPLTIKRIVPK